MIERYFSDFLAWFFPKAHAGIDWARGYEFLDQELEASCNPFAVVTQAHLKTQATQPRSGGTVSLEMAVAAWVI